MTAEPEDDQGEHEAPLTTFWSRLSEEDRRLGVVTFAATLAANMATAVIIAVALLAAHAVNIMDKAPKPLPKSPSPDAWLGWAIFAATACIPPLILWLNFSKRGKRIMDSAPGFFIKLASGALLVLSGIFGLLVVLGRLLAVR